MFLVTHVLTTGFLLICLRWHSAGHGYRLLGSKHLSGLMAVSIERVKALCFLKTDALFVVATGTDKLCSCAFFTQYSSTAERKNPGKTMSQPRFKGKFRKEGEVNRRKKASDRLQKIIVGLNEDLSDV